MAENCVYMDNHSTTRVDPRVVEAMLPFFVDTYGNAGSTTHVFGWEARDAVQRSRQEIAAAIGAEPREIVFTSGATESNNLAIRGVADRYSGKTKHVITVATEHRAVLDPVNRLARRGFRVTILPVRQNGQPDAGMVELDRLEDEIRDDTILVSVMLANNEIGVIQPMAEIAQICRRHGVLLHSDATQAVGKIPVDVGSLGVDLMSFSAHKIYGPRGIGALYVKRRTRLVPQIDGGGQEHGLRSGTLNAPGIVGFAAAASICGQELEAESARLAALRNRLFTGLSERITETSLNGPSWEGECHSGRLVRLPGNLNMAFGYVEGESLMLNIPGLAVSSGSACTSATPEPSHVLRALGLSESQARSSLRFGLGRFNTTEDVEFAIEAIAGTVRRLREHSSMLRESG
jgi:cysteine desulfurase